MAEASGDWRPFAGRGKTCGVAAGSYRCEGAAVGLVGLRKGRPGSSAVDGKLRGEDVRMRRGVVRRCWRRARRVELEIEVKEIGGHQGGVLIVNMASESELQRADKVLKQKRRGLLRESFYKGTAVASVAGLWLKLFAPVPEPLVRPLNADTM
jgi:hypothetical protein